MISQRLDLHNVRNSFITNQITPQFKASPALLAAFEKVPRELFLDPSHASLAYVDRDIKIPSNRQALSSRKLAKIFSYIDFSQKPKMLLIGFNMGYSMAIAYEMQAKVYGIEQNALLFNYASTSLQHYFDTFYGRTNLDDCLLMEQLPHAQGMPEEGPFDIILIEGEAEVIPKTLTDQLRSNGSILYISPKDPKGITTLSRQGQRRYHDYERAFVLEGMSQTKSFEF